MKKKILKNACYVLGVILVSVLMSGGALYLFTDRESVQIENKLGISWYNETDTEFVINTAEELYQLAELSKYYNFKGQTFKLGADIVLNEGNAADWEVNSPANRWTPIDGFNGTFDGQGHTISGLYAKGYNVPLALFTNTTRTTQIQNFKLTNSYLEGRGFGGVASIVSNGGGKLKQIYSDAQIKIVGEYSGFAGGICSKVDVQSTIEECWYDGIITTTGRDAGGILDAALGSVVSISHCLFSGEINGNWNYSGTRIGGIVGQVVKEGGTLALEDCLSVGNITAEANAHTGSVLGTAMAGTRLTCVDTYSARETYGPIGDSGTNGEIQSMPLEMISENLVGYKAYQWTMLDFDKYWTVVEDDSPALKCFVQNPVSLDGVKKAYDISWYNEGASENVITTLEQLYGFYVLSGNTNFAGKTIKLGADIVINEGDSKTWKEKAPETPWYPISGFAGTFDGQGHTISGMYMDVERRYVGFFGMTDSLCTVKNFSLKNSMIINEMGGTRVLSTGSIAGVGNGTFENIYSDAIMNTAGIYMGGMFGQVYKQSTISNCWYDGKITHYGRYAGGVVGIVSGGTIKVEHCLNTAAMDITWEKGFCNSGGIVGSTLSSDSIILSITDCLNVGTITANQGGVGSVLGHCVKGNAIIKDSYAVKGSNAKDGKGIGYNQGIIQGGVVTLDKELLTGYKAFDWTSLDFAENWSVVLNGTPILKQYASSSPSVAGRTKEFDTSWYNKDEKMFVIKNQKQLYGFYYVSMMTDFKDKTVKLGANITLNTGDANAWTAEAAPAYRWFPIVNFAGTFDGQGHTISGMYINADARYAGFFGKTTVDAAVKNIRIENSKIINHLGGTKLLTTGSVAGAGLGTFDTIYSNAILDVSGDGVGGLFGQIYKNTTITNCQYDGVLTNVGRYTGGIVGCATGETLNISHCLNSGTINVTRKQGFVQTGGILGGSYYKDDLVVNITDCFNSGHVVTNQGGTGSILGHCIKGTVNIKNTYAATESNKKDAKSVGNVQGVVTGNVIQFPGHMLTGTGGYRCTTLDYNKYWAAVDMKMPQLRCFASGALSVTGLEKIYDTSWYDANKSVYTLSDERDLYGFTILSMNNDFSGKTIKLSANITLNEGDADTYETTPPTQGWIPISKFAGTFDGQGHTIKGLYVPSGSKVGFFSETTKTAVIKNLKFEETYICGIVSGVGTGSIVGRGGGTFSSIYSDAIVKNAYNSVGGIIGYINADTTMDQVQYAGTATGRNQVGGFAANVKGANVTFTNCHMSGTVVTTATSGHMNAGMFVGMIDAESDVAAIKSLATGYLKPAVISKNNYSRSLVGKVTGNNALFHGEGVIRVSDTGHVHSDNSGVIGIFNLNSQYVNCGWKGTAGSGIKPLAIAQMTGANAMYNFNGIEFCDNAADTSKPWVAILDGTPQLRIFAEKTQIVDLTEYVVADVTWYTEVPAGVGTSEDNPYIIEDEDDLLGLSVLVNAGHSFDGCFVKVINDIEYNTNTPATLNEWKNYEAKNSFTPIGTTANAFNGSFDGKGHTIKGIYISTTSNNVGLFGATGSNATIKNLKLQNSYIGGKQAVGSIVGRGGGTFTNVHSNAVVVATEQAGGILGQRNTYTVTMTKCSYSGELSATGNNVGGLLGIMQGASKDLIITNCEFKGNVNTTGSQAGGFIGGVGGNSEVKITGCKSIGTVTADGEKAGGYIGTIAAAATIIIQNSESDATITVGSLKAGGYIGYNQSATKVTIKTSTSGATVTATGKQAGGFIGMTDKPVELSSVQFAGTATGLQHVAGFIGAVNNTAVTVTDGLMSGTVHSTITAADIAAKKDSKQGVSVGGICGIIVNAKADVTVTRCLITGTITCAASGDANCGEHVGRMDKGKYTSDNVYVQKGCCASFEDTDMATDTAVGYKADAAAFDIKETCKRLNASELKGEEAKMNASGLFADNNNWATQVLGHPTLTLLSWYDPEKNEFYINSKADLFEFAKASRTDNFAGKTVYLGDNIVVNEGTAEELLARATDSDMTNDPIAWTPIRPSTTNLFAGVFDGQGHTISGIYINSSNTSLQGLFAYVGDNDGDCQIKNFTLNNTYIHGKDNTGSIVAAQREKATFENLTSNAVIKGAAKVGGIIGEVQATVDGTTITDCTFNGSITATANNSGGMIGLTSGNGTNGNFTITLNNCTFGQGGSIVGTQAGGMIGGIGAAQNAVTLNSCTSEGTINATTVGGVIGKVANTQKNTKTGTRMNGCTVSATLVGTTKGKYVGTISSSVISYVFLNNHVLTTTDNTYSSKGNE